MAILGGSPLGLINVRSTPTRTGLSTFNDGNTRNVNVSKYNISSTVAAQRGNSLFTGDKVIRPWPDISVFEETLPGLNHIDYSGQGNAKGKYNQRKSLHNSDVYDTSVLNIIEHLAGTSAGLKMADFAYLRDLGVYPNNRLMIARRFAGPISDNIVGKRKKNAKGNYEEYGAISTLISWLPQDTDYLNISFGEKWTEAEADFKDLLNRIGGDIQTKGSSTAGNVMESLSNAIPLPGFTEGFQRKFLEKMGIYEEGAGQTIPSGNPNLIKEAKRRTTVPYESAGSGLSCTVDIEMSCEYELKFISGIDPTIVWMDIISNVLRFGTSPSDTYGLSTKLNPMVEKWLKDPWSAILLVFNNLKSSLTEFANELTDKINQWSKEQYDLLTKSKTEKEATATEQEGKRIEGLKAPAYKFVDFALKFIQSGLETLAKKYKVEIMGIMNSLTGMASTPWHITIGNPLRPVFCAGDLLTTNVKLTLGPSLAFNDLPSSIKISFTLTNARPWGLQEIMAKFNSGYIRSVDVQKSFFETNQNEQPGLFPFEKPSVPDPPVVAATPTVSATTPAVVTTTPAVTTPAVTTAVAATTTPAVAATTPAVAATTTPAVVTTKVEGDKLKK